MRLRRDFPLTSVPFLLTTPCKFTPLTNTQSGGILESDK